MKKGAKKTAAVVLAASMTLADYVAPALHAGGAAVVEAAEDTADENGFVIDEKGVLTGYEGTAAQVVIPGTVTTIGSKAFENHTEITSVVVPDSVKEIQSKAFAGCSALASLQLPSSLETIGDEVLKDCPLVTSVKIPKSLKEAEKNYLNYGKGPFSGSSVQTVEFEAGITTIPGWLFSGIGAADIQIPDTVTTIEDGAFYGCSGLTGVTIPDSVTKIGAEAFMECENLAQVKLSNALQMLGSKAFMNCPKITAIEIPASLEEGEWDYLAHERGPFAGTGISTVTFEEGITTISEHLFAGVETLKNIDIPDSVTTIKPYAFYKSGLTSIKMGEYVTKVEEYAFAECADVTSLDIGEYVQELGKGVFYNDKGITSVHIPVALDKAETDSFFSWKKGPFAETGLKEVTFEEGVTQIAEYLFAGCSSLDKIEIPSTVERIEAGAFYGCENIKEFDLPWGLFEIGERAFSECNGITSFTMKDNVATLGRYAFEKCTALKSVKFSDSLKEIPVAAFREDAALENVILPDHVSVVNENAFSGCSSLAGLEAAGLMQIGDGAFLNTGFTELSIPSGVQRIGDGAFSESVKLRSVVIPDSVKKMSKNCFYKCGALEEVQFGIGLAEIPEGCFSDCSKLNKVVFPYGVTTLKQDIFHNCTSLTEVTIPKTVTNMEDGMFSYPKKVTVYCVAGSTAESYAKKNNMNVSLLDVPAQSVSLSDTDIMMFAGQEKELVLTVNPINFTDDVIWTTADEKIAEVDENGLVRAKGTGSTVITAAVGEQTVSCVVNVMKLDKRETVQTNTVIAKDKTQDAVAEGEKSVIRFNANALPAGKAVIVRSELLGNTDDAEVYNEISALLTVQNGYNTEAFRLYRMAVRSQEDGADVQLASDAQVTLEVPENVNISKAVIARIEEGSGSAVIAEIINGEVSADDMTITFNTAQMGMYAVVEASAAVMGDVDGNGKVELADAQLTLKAALKLTTLEGAQISAADVDSNGKVELADAQKILKVALKIEKF